VHARRSAFCTVSSVHIVLNAKYILINELHVAVCFECTSAETQDIEIPCTIVHHVQLYMKLIVSFYVFLSMSDTCGCGDSPSGVLDNGVTTWLYRKLYGLSRQSGGIVSIQLLPVYIDKSKFRKLSV
jgi:hypothetical protein